tara:strand:- start:177 stop:404 length:228 start_codon:yes stop_codon:yes gene_type:complete
LAGDSLEGLEGGSTFSGLADGVPPPGGVSFAQRFNVAGIAALETGSVFIDAERFFSIGIEVPKSAGTAAAASRDA